MVILYTANGKKQIDKLIKSYKENYINVFNSSQYLQDNFNHNFIQNNLKSNSSKIIYLMIKNNFLVTLNFSCIKKYCNFI